MLVSISYSSQIFSPIIRNSSTLTTLLTIQKKHDKGMYKLQLIVKTSLRGQHYCLFCCDMYCVIMDMRCGDNIYKINQSMFFMHYVALYVVHVSALISKFYCCKKKSTNCSSCSGPQAEISGPKLSAMFKSPILQ